MLQEGVIYKGTYVTVLSEFLDIDLQAKFDLVFQNDFNLSKSQKTCARKI